MNKKRAPKFGALNGDPCENRTRVTAVKGPCLNRLTNGPYFTKCGSKSAFCLVAGIGLEPMTYRV